MAIVFLVYPACCAVVLCRHYPTLNEFYGPQGIREFVETALRISGSWTDYPLEIVEIGGRNSR